MQCICDNATIILWYFGESCKPVVINIHRNLHQTQIDINYSILQPEPTLISLYIASREPDLPVFLKTGIKQYFSKLSVPIF